MYTILEQIMTDVTKTIWITKPLKVENLYRAIFTFYTGQTAMCTEMPNSSE
jgi:hypothetical protein